MEQSVKSEAKVLTRHSFIYGLAPVLSNIVGFIMLPIYTRYLTPADYGVLELISVTTNLLTIVIGIGLQTAVTRFYFDFGELSERRRVVSTAYIGYGFVVIAVVAALMPFSGVMAKYILGSIDRKMLFVVALSSLALDILLQIGFSYLRVEQKSILVTAFSLGKTVLALSLNIYFVVILNRGVMGILLSSLITNVIFTTSLTAYSLKTCGVKINFGLLSKMVKFGLPLMPSDISAYIVHASDRFFLKSYSTMSLTGLYSLGYKLGTLTNQFVTAPFVQIWGPRRYENFNVGDSERIYARIFTYFVALIVFAGLGISLFSEEAIKIMAAKPFWPAYKVVPIIALSYIVLSFNYHFTVGIIMKKATKYIAYANITSAILNLILNFILIKRFDIWGAAYATLISFAYKTVLTFYYSNRLFKIEVEWRRIILLFATAFICYAPGLFITTESLWIDIAIKSGLCAGYPALLYITRFFDQSELNILKNFAKTRKLSALFD